MGLSLPLFDKNSTPNGDGYVPTPKGCSPPPPLKGCLLTPSTQVTVNRVTENRVVLPPQEETLKP